MPTQRPAPDQRQSWNGHAIASPFTVPCDRSPPMCRQYASSTCNAPSELANTTSLAPNAVIACGLPSWNSSARPRQCQPRANRSGIVPVSIERTASLPALVSIATLAPRSPVCVIGPPGLDQDYKIEPVSESVPDERFWCKRAARPVVSTPIRTCSSLCGMSSVTTPAEVLAGVSELLPTLRERAQQTEELRRIPDETIAQLQSTGV